MQKLAISGEKNICIIGPYNRPPSTWVVYATHISKSEIPFLLP